MRGKLLEDLEELVFNQRRWKLVPQQDVIFGNFMMWVRQCHLYHLPVITFFSRWDGYHSQENGWFVVLPTLSSI